MDVAVALTALLETGVATGGNDLDDLEDEDEKIRREIQNREASYIRNFWAAFDSVSSFGIANNASLEKGY